MKDKKTEALKLALEYRPTMPLAVLHSWAGDMKKSAQKALAEQPAQQYNATSDSQLMEMPKIGCVNHDCDQCKYKYDCDKAEQPTVKQSLTVEPTQATEHCLWARNGNQPCPHVQAGQQEQKPFGYLWPTGMHPEFRYTQQKRDGVDGMPVYTSPQPAQQAPLASSAWQEGYDQGVADERTSEANIGIAGFGAKVNPARNNPYTAPQPAQQQEPVLWLVNGVVQSSDIPADYTGCLFTSPPAPKPWVGLTKQEIDKIYRDLPHPVPHWQLSRAIEAKLREKNNG